MSNQSAGYIELLRRNSRFRRLWYGQIVSQLGDWFDNIALATLVFNLTGSGQAVGLLLVAEFLPPTLVSPFAGVLLDRVPRKLVLVLSDLGRAVLVLLLLLVRGPEDLWLIYTVVVLKVSLVGIFEPARSALLPDVVSREELVAANAISSATWSAVLAVGAALGGLVAGVLGVQAAFVLDALSYIVSAWLIDSIPVRESHQTAPGAGPPVARRSLAASFQAGGGELVEGLRFISSQRDLFLLAFAKALWNLSGGVLVLFTLFGRDIFPVGEDGALSIGLFYAARGVGAGIGPLLVQRFTGQSLMWMRRAVGLSYFVSTVGYLWLAGTEFFALALLAVVLGHMGGSVNWVFSTALLQIRVPGNLRGRVFAVEFAALMFTTAVSSYVTGFANDLGATPRELSVALALLLLLPGTLLTVLLWRQPHESQAD